MNISTRRSTLRQHLRRDLLHGDRLPRFSRDHRHHLPDRLPGPGLQGRLHARSSTSASRRPPGTGISSTSYGCSCSSRSTSGVARARRPTAVDGRGAACRRRAVAGGGGFEGLCPRCGARTLFAGLARFAPSCSSCGLDFASYNVGDGPAAFLILIVGAIVAVECHPARPGRQSALVGASDLAAGHGRANHLWPAPRQGSADLPGA